MAVQAKNPANVAVIIFEFNHQRLINVSLTRKEVFLILCFNHFNYFEVEKNVSTYRHFNSIIIQSIIDIVIRIFSQGYCGDTMLPFIVLFSLF